MSGRPSRRQRTMRGQPLMVMAMLVLAWGGFRYATWAAPFDQADGAFPELTDQLQAVISDPPIGSKDAPFDPRLQMHKWRDHAPEGSQAAVPDWQVPALPDALTPPSWSDPALTGAASTDGEQVSAADVGDRPARPVAPRMAAGNVLLMAAGFAQMEVPAEIAALMTAAVNGGRRDPASGQQDGAALLTGQAAAYPAPPQALAASASGEKRWSVDGWLLWRNDTSNPVFSGRPSYGRSQAGVVARYRLAPSSGNRPEAYLRGSSALEGAREREVAAGLSARPIAALPLRVAGELRASSRIGGTEVRPAAFAVTEIAPQNLPGGLRAEVYAQAGYVGGTSAGRATAFADGQARIDRSIAASDDFDLRTGGGVWAGAQRDAARVDIGPTASVSFRVGDGRGRLAADYRVRVAGDARPASGPALTLSAGF